MSRVYYLRLTKADFASTSSTQWVSHPIDVYVNDSYINYSTVKSTYGLDLVDGSHVNRKFVWVGMQKLTNPFTWQDYQYFTWEDLADQTWVEEGSLHTDTGEIWRGRYVDKSGQTDIINYTLDIAPSEAVDSHSLEIYEAGSPHAQFPDEWVKTTADLSEINVINSQRYLKFVLDFDPYVSDFDGTLYVRIEISRPLMAPLYMGTRNILDKFPRWTAIREFENEAPPILELAEPTSVGGKLINAISGEWIDDLKDNIQYLIDQHFIDTVDLGQKSWVYRTDGVPPELWQIAGDNGFDGFQEDGEWAWAPIGRAIDLRELLEASSEEHVGWWDESHSVIYSNQKYDKIVLNGIKYNQEPHHVWNWLDEIGLTLDLKRLLLEENDSFRLRILDVYINRGGVGVDQFKLAIRRELNLWKYWPQLPATPPSIDEIPATPATPDSFYPYGATPEVLEMADIEKDPLYVTEEGLPTDKFVKLVEKLSKEHPATWGRFRWDKALWDISGPKFEGFGLLPYRLDATPVPLERRQSGVGDGDDLYVFRPEIITGAHSFTARLRVRGRQKIGTTDYPPFKFDIKVWGEADKSFYQNPLSTIWLTLEFVTNSGTFYSSFQMSTRSDATTDPVTSGSWASKTIFDIDDYTSSDLEIGKKTDGTPWNTTDNRVPFSSITSVKLKNGQWNVSGQTYADGQLSDLGTAFFSDSPSTQLTYTNSTGITMTSAVRPTVQLRSDTTATVVGKWKSEPVTYTIELNSQAPFSVPHPLAFDLPAINWPPDLQPTPNKKYAIEISSALSSDEGQNLLSLNDSGNPLSVGGWTGFIGDVSYGVGPGQIGSDSAFSIVSLLNAGAAAIGPEVQVTPGNSYTLSGLVISDPLTVPVSASIRIDWHDAAHIYLSSNTGSTPFLEEKGTWSSDWTFLQDVGVAPPNAAYAVPTIVWNTTLAGSVNWFNNISLTEDDHSVLFGATVDSFEGTNHEIPSSYILLDGSNSWINNRRMYIDGATTSITFASGTGSLYPASGSLWTLFELTQDGTITGLVDENGPWRNNQAPLEGNTNFALTTINVARADFGLPDTTDFVVTWMGIDLLGGEGVVVWLDNNLVKSAVSESYDELPSGTGVIQERYDNGVYFYDPFVVRAKLTFNPNAQWSPQLHTGWFYEGNKDFYFYADPVTETTDEQTYVLSGLARQGAPIIVLTDEATPTEFRQVAFFDEATPNPTLQITHTQELVGTGTNRLYIAYDNTYDVSITDTTVNESIVSSTSSPSNVIITSLPTDKTHTYLVTYTLSHSFYADNYFVDANGDYRTKLYFDVAGGDRFPPVNYSITYENAILNPAAEIDVPLNPLYTTVNEGFIFISHDEYDFSKVLLYLTPSQIIADGNDYLIVNLFSVDAYGNPKPGQTFALDSTWGSLDDLSVTTDRDGYAVATLNASGTTTTLDGLITVTNVMTSNIATASFTIQPATERGYRLFAAVKPQEIPADGRSSAVVYGKVEDNSYNGVPNAVVKYKIAMSIYELFTGAPASSQVIADANGYFTITYTNTYPNLLTAQESSFELSSTSGWVADNAITTIGRIIAAGEGFSAPNGLYVLAATSSSLGDTLVKLNRNIPLTPSVSYQASLLVETTNFSARVEVKVYDSSNTLLGEYHGNIAEGDGFNLTTVIIPGHPTASYAVLRWRGIHVTANVRTYMDSAVLQKNPTPGFWFMSLESQTNAVSSWDATGDVVFWHEYPDTQFGVDPMTGLHPPYTQMVTPISAIPEYANLNHLPVYYDDEAPFAPATPVTLIWRPPPWYIIKNTVKAQTSNDFANRGDGIEVVLNIGTLRDGRPGKWRIFI